MNTSLIAIRLLSVAELAADAEVAQIIPAGGNSSAARSRANICGNCPLVPPAVRALHARTRARRLPARARRLRPPRPQRLLVLQPPGAPSRMPSVEESELEAGLAEDSWPVMPEISYTEQRTSASL